MYKFRLHIFSIITLWFLCFSLVSTVEAQQFEFVHSRKKEFISFKFIKNLIIIPVKINGKGPFNFVLDTGVGLCLITDASLIDTLKPKSVRKIPVTGFGDGETLNALVIPAMHFEIGNVAAYDMPSAILEEDAFDLSSFAGMPVHGLIGYEFFNSFIVRLNYISNLITLYPNHTGAILRKGFKIPISIEDRKPYIFSQIGLDDGKTVNAKLIIDTGSGHPISLETDSGVPFDPPVVNIAANLGIGLSGPINGYLGRIKYLTLGKYQLKNVLTAFPNYADVAAKITSIRRTGNMGNSILRRFNVVFDYSRSSMYLKPTASLKETFEHDMSGMELYSAGEHFKKLYVLRVEPSSPAYECGLKKDDEILTINLKSVANMTREEIDAIFKSKNDRSILLELVRKGSKKVERSILTLRRRI
jgi:hypothetical protein